MHEITYISSDEGEEDDDHGDYNSADEGNVLHPEYIRRRTLGSNYNNYQKKPKVKRQTRKRKTPPGDVEQGPRPPPIQYGKQRKKTDQRQSRRIP